MSTDEQQPDEQTAKAIEQWEAFAESPEFKAAIADSVDAYNASITASPEMRAKGWRVIPTRLGRWAPPRHSSRQLRQPRTVPVVRRARVRSHRRRVHRATRRVAASSGDGSGSEPPPRHHRSLAVEVRP
jgi:hypothetical protein